MYKKIAFWEESNFNSQLDVLRMNESMSDMENLADNCNGLSFKNTQEALQYLSDLINKKIIIQD